MFACSPSYSGPSGPVSKLKAIYTMEIDRRSPVQAPNAPRGQSQHPRARNDYDEETAYESYMNPEPGFQSGPGDSVDAD